MSKKIAVIGANGNSGKLIVEEAVNRGFDVTAIVRSENKTKAQNVIQKDLYDLTLDDLKGVDAVVSAIAVWSDTFSEEHTKATKFLANLLLGTDIRLLFVGGASSLYIDETKTTQLFDTPEFPKEYIPVASSMKAALEELRKFDNVKWTYISPAAEFNADGKRTGEYILAGEIFTVNDKGESEISYADYAIAMVDEIEKGNHIKERISVLGK